MICPTCAAEGRKSRVTQTNTAICFVPAVYFLPQWDENGNRVMEQERPRAEAQFECSNGHRFTGESAP